MNQFLNIKLFHKSINGLLLTLLLSIDFNFAAAGISQDSDRIFNWAENQFDFFPSHQISQTFDQWRFRFYPGTGIYAGVNLNDGGVYVLGGQFGEQALYIDTVDNILQLVLPYELDTQRINTVFNRIAQAESDEGFRPDTGIWGTPDRPESGLEIHFSGSDLLLIWYTFDANGLPIWYFAIGPYNSSKNWTAELLQFQYNQLGNQLETHVLGSISLSFFDSKQALLTWDFNGSNGSFIIEPVIYSEIRPAFDLTGIFIDPNDLTWGLSTDLQGSTLSIKVYGYDRNGKPRWLTGIKTDVDVEHTNVLNFDLLSFTNGSGPNVDYQAPIANAGGTISLNLGELSKSRALLSSKKSALEKKSIVLESKRGINALNVEALNFGDQSVFQKVSQQTQKFTLPKLSPVIHGPDKVAPGSEGHNYSVSFVSDPILDLIPPSYTWQEIENVKSIVNNNSSQTTVGFRDPSEDTGYGAFSVELRLPMSDVPYEVYKIVTLTNRNNTNLSFRIFGTNEVSRDIGAFYGVKIFSGLPPYKYAWTFSDGGTANNATVIHTFTQLGPAWVEITVTASDGEKEIQKTERFDINVVEGPFIAKITGPDKVDTGQAAFFRVADQPTIPSNIIWNSDGTTQCGTSNACTIIWDSSGPGTVTAQIVDAIGQSVGNLLKKQVQVTAEPISIAWVTSTPELKTAEKGTWTVNIEEGDGPYTVRFIFGDGVHTVLNEPSAGTVTTSHEYNKSGSYQVFATVFDRNCDNASTSKADVQVESSLSINIISGPTGLAEFDTGTWVLEVEGADTVTVNWGDGKEGTFSSYDSIQHFYAQPGTYTIEFTAVGPGGEKKTVFDSINVFDDAIARCKAELDPPCASGYVTIEHTGLNGNNKKTINTKSIAECEQACNAETEFECKSFDYNPLDDFPTFEDLCVLSDKNRCDAVSFTSSDTHPWSYHERCSVF